MVALVAGWDGNFDDGSVDFVDGLCNPASFPERLISTTATVSARTTRSSPSAVPRRPVPSRWGAARADLSAGHAINIIGSKHHRRRLDPDRLPRRRVRRHHRNHRCPRQSGRPDAHFRQRCERLHPDRARAWQWRLQQQHHRLGDDQCHVLRSRTHCPDRRRFGCLLADWTRRNRRELLPQRKHLRDQFSADSISSAELRAFAQIGHGGIGGTGALGGAISVSSATTGAPASIAVTGGTNTNAYAQIGHGGATSTGTVALSDVSIDATGSISLTGGGASAYAQIGHGGYNAINLTVADSDITLNAAPGSGTGDIVLTAVWATMRSDDRPRWQSHQRQCWSR